MERYAALCATVISYLLPFREQQWHVEPPVPVDVYSCERFLTTSPPSRPNWLPRRELLRDFGENTPCSRKCVGAFYQALTTSRSPKINALYRQWARTFSEICGYEPDSPKLDVEQLARLYAVRAGRGQAPALQAFLCHPQLLRHVHQAARGSDRQFLRSHQSRPHRPS